MIEELPKLLPVSILLTTFNRIGLLKKTIDLINERTFYPFRILVIDNNSNDGTQGYLREAKVQGKVFDSILLPENIGQSKALNEGFKMIEKWENELRRPSNDFFVTTNDDIYPPMLGQDNCWLKQMVDILQRNEPEYGGICMRIQRTARTDINEDSEIIPCHKGFPSVFRLLRRDDYRKLGDRPFGRLLKWDSNSAGDKFKLQLHKKFGFTTKIYADHAGFIINSGYKEGTDTFTVAENKIRISEEKPYPDIDPLTNVPVKINHHCDQVEQDKREEYDKGEKPEATVIVLTYKRPEGLSRIIDSIKSKTKAKYKLLVVVDNDDTLAYNYCIENNIDCILSSFHRDFVAQANMGIYSCDTPYFVVLADDSEVLDEGWLEKSLRVFKERFKDDIGLLAFNDGIQKGRIFTMGMSSKKFVHHIGGHLYYPLYKHYKGDREVSELAKKLNLFQYDSSINVKHYHWQRDDTVEKDITYQISEDKYLLQDRILYDDRDKNVDLIKEKNYCNFNIL